jgi:micrococcal nuclease
MRNKNIFLLSAALAILSLCAASPVKFNSQLPAFEKITLSDLPAYQVLRIVNGETIVIDMNSQDMKIKLIGVKPAEKYGAEMTLFVKNLLKGENVYIVDDSNQNEPNKYGYYIYRLPDGLFVNAEIIRQGYGLADTIAPFKYMAQFKQLEEFAKERSKGLWDAGRSGSVSRPAPVTPTVSTEPTISSKTSTQGEDIIVYVTKTGKKYHLSSCSYLSKSAVPMKLSDAKAQGFAPCSKCNPP